MKNIIKLLKIENFKLIARIIQFVSHFNYKLILINNKWPIKRESNFFLQYERSESEWDSILFVGHLFHDCDRTFGPRLRRMNA